MRLAALYDIHGNLPALEAVLDDVRASKVDQLLVGGDVCPGPMCEEVLELLLGCGIPVRFIRGNGDREMLAIAEGRETTGVPDSHLPSMRWVAERLSDENRQFMATWPEKFRADIAELGYVLFCHATPRNDTEIFTASTPDDRLRPMFEGANARLVVCGHTHMQFDRKIGLIRVVNAGSVGMPFGEPGACWLLLDGSVKLRRTSYDLESAATRIRATGYPEAEEFAARHVLQRPSTEEMLAIFSRAELK